jgi:acetyl esterase/lipase
MTAQELETLLGLFRRQEPQKNPTIETMRSEMNRIGDFLPVPDAATVSNVDVHGIPAEWVADGVATPARTVLYLHGGGYVMGGPQTHRTLAYNIAAAADARCLLLDYRLAPEHPFPAAVEDAATAYRWLLAGGADPSSIIVAGDSAGGGLTVATMVKLRDEGIDLPGAAVCLSPWTDMEGQGDSMTANAAKDPMVQADGLARIAKAYLNGADPQHPLAAPIHADLSGLPPMLIQVGSDEVLLDDASRLADRARAAGVDVVYEEWPQMFHVWQLFAPMLSEGRDAIARIGTFAKQHAAG